MKNMNPERIFAHSLAVGILVSSPSGPGWCKGGIDSGLKKSQLFQIAEVKVEREMVSGNGF